MKNFSAKVVHLAAGAAQHSSESHGEVFHFVLIGIDPDDNSIHVAGTLTEPFVVAHVTSMATRKIMEDHEMVSVSIGDALRVPVAGNGTPPKDEQH